MKSTVDYLVSRLLRSDRLYWPAARALAEALPAEQALEASTQNLRDNRQIDPSSPVFVTARFRSGSTFLWQLLNAFKQVTCYYEPLNERKWYLPESAAQGVDESHLGVTDYRRGYDGLTDLDKYFDSLWTTRRLYMGHGHSDPSLKRYIEALISRSSDRAILQFNRVDFRLGWLRANFSNAGILHLYRDPREQWMSIMEAGSSVPIEKLASDFRGYKLFYMYQWARDLSLLFPFLDPQKASHPYVLHYYLWQLSYKFGKRFADLSISYENLVQDLDGTINQIAEVFCLADPPFEELRALNRGRVTERWKAYADEDWYRRHEEACDQALSDYFGGVESSR